MGNVRKWMAMALVGWLACTGLAQAQTRAWLDRDHINQGDAVTLNIETDQLAAKPDYAPLQADFTLYGYSSSLQASVVNGSFSTTATFSVKLAPRHGGTLQIPALRVDAAHTQPLQLTVAATPATATASRAGDAEVFVETEVDDSQPYVQQSVGVVVRLYRASEQIDGELAIDPPASATLQHVGQDQVSERQVGGRNYNVVEQHFLLIPERSGPLQLEGAHFEGRDAGGVFDDFFGNGGAEIHARAPTQTLQVRAMPDAAPQPWLPLKDLRLRYLAVPQAARVGEAATVVVEATAIGATYAQFPPLPAPSLGAAAQVFAEPPQYDEILDAAGPQLKLTRRYSIVPRQAGALRIPGIRMTWWDARAGQARTTSLPDVNVQVAPDAAAARVAAQASPLPARVGNDAAIAPPPTRAAPAWRWPLLAVGFAVLWLGTLTWVVLARRRAAAGGTTPERARKPSATGSHASLADLKRALDSGGFDEIELALRGMAQPPVADLDALAARLDDPAQRAALDALRRARWASGDGVAARAALRAAFDKGPSWRGSSPEPPEPLPPLYPETGAGKEP